MYRKRFKSSSGINSRQWSYGLSSTHRCAKSLSLKTATYFCPEILSVCIGNACLNSPVVFNCSILNRIHSGYDDGSMLADKRMSSTTLKPSCERILAAVAEGHDSREDQAGSYPDVLAIKISYPGFFVHSLLTPHELVDTSAACLRSSEGPQPYARQPSPCDDPSER